MSGIKQTIIEHPSEAKDVIPKDWYDLTVAEWNNYLKGFTTYWSLHARYTWPNNGYVSKGCHIGLSTYSTRDKFLSNIIMKNTTAESQRFYDFLFSPERSPYADALDGSYLVMKDKRPIMIFWPDAHKTPTKLLANMLICSRFSSQYAQAPAIDRFVNEHGLSYEEAIILASLYRIGYEYGGNAVDYQEYYEKLFTKGVFQSSSFETPSGDAAFNHRHIANAYDPFAIINLVFDPVKFIKHDYTKDKSKLFSPCNYIWDGRKTTIINHDKLTITKDRYPVYNMGGRKHFYKIMKDSFEKSQFKVLPKEFIAEIKEVFNSEKELRIDP